MAKSTKKRAANTNGVKRVSKDRVAVGLKSLLIVNKLINESQA